MLSKLHDESFHRFFGVWIYSLNAIFAALAPEMTHEEISRCTLLVHQLYNEITNRSEQLWLLCDLEYLHFILSKLCGQFFEEKSFNLMLGTLYNIIMTMSPPVDTSVEATSIESPNNYPYQSYYSE